MIFLPLIYFFYLYPFLARALTMADDGVHGGG